MRMRAQQVAAVSSVLSFFIGSPGWPTKGEAAGVQAHFGIESPTAVISTLCAPRCCR